MPKIPNSAREFVVNENGEIIDQPMTRTRVIHPEGGPLITKQSMAAQTDINQIMNRWVAHGIPPVASGKEPTYGDFANAQDFHASLNAVMAAQDQFDRLPAHIRKHCNNDPGEFLDLVYDPLRQAELVELGLKPDTVPAAAQPKPVEEPPAPAPQPVP